MKKSLILFVLFVHAAIAMAQVDAKHLDSLNALLSHKLLRYHFPHQASKEGILLTQLSAGSPERDIRGQYPYIIDFIKWADVTSVSTRLNSNADGQVLVIYGTVKNYMFSTNTRDIEYDGRGYKFSHDEDWISLFYFGKEEYEVMNKIRGLIRIFTGK